MVDWSINGAEQGFQNALALGANIGGALKQRREDSALAAFVTNPGDESLAGLAKVNPSLAYQARGQLQQQEAARLKAEKEAQAARLEQLPTVGKLLRYAAQGPSQWSEALAEAQRLGIDVSNVPQQFSPEWANQQAGIADLLASPKGQEALSSYGKLAIDRGYKPGTPEFAKVVTEAWQADQVKTIPYTQGGGVAGYNPATGTISTIVAPNPGGFTAGAPVQSAPVQKTIGGKTYEKRGDQWFEVGGGSGNATGGFPASGPVG